MDKKYWENYYETHSLPAKPSLFARFALENYMESEGNLIELGCGNGRDSIFFAENNITVYAIDQVKKEIDLLSDEYAMNGLTFLQGDFTQLDFDGPYTYIYSRFTLHSVSEEQEMNVLQWGRKSLSKTGVFFIEVRSVNDEKLQEGERLSANENLVDGHYRRYFELDIFREKLEMIGYEILYAEERTGFAPHPSEDPPVIRIVCKNS